MSDSYTPIDLVDLSRKHTKQNGPQRPSDNPEAAPQQSAAAALSIEQQPAPVSSETGNEADPFAEAEYPDTFAEQEPVHQHQDPPPDPHDLITQTDSSNQPEIPEDLQRHGLKAVSDPRIEQVHLPISDTQVMEGMKEPQTSSLRWLAEFSTYLLKKAHIKLKRVGGNVVRILQK